MPPESTHVRALSLSFSLGAAHEASSASDHGSSNLRAWAAHVVFAFSWFEEGLGGQRLLSTGDIQHPVLKLVCLERLDAAGAWMPVTPTTPDDAALPLQQLRVRSIKRGAFGVDYATGKRVFEWRCTRGQSLFVVPSMCRCGGLATSAAIGSCLRPLLRSGLGPIMRCGTFRR